MAEDYGVANIVAAIEQRSFPTITVWNRIEGRPRRPDFTRALKAEVRDARFMLSKQWQMGEFLADDAGSPATVKVQLATTKLQTYRAARGPTLPFDDTLPLEARVERRALPLVMDGNAMSLDIRLLLGRQWLKMMEPIADYSGAFVQKYSIKPPDPTRPGDAYVCAHSEAWQMVAAVAGRRMDGGLLYGYLIGGANRHAWDGIPSILATHQAAIDDAAAAFMNWVTNTFTQPPSKDEDAWLSDRLEYQFSCAAPEGTSETVFEAEQFYRGRLDWYDLEVERRLLTLGPPAKPRRDPRTAGATRPADATATGAKMPGVQATVLQSLIPVPISYDGMPNTRWWAFEDRRVNFGAVTPATTDLGKLLFLEFGLVYANDWFLIPLTLQTGTVARVRGMCVTNVFGERFWIEAAGAGKDDDWQRWSMFTVSVKGNEPTQQADTCLLLLPTVPKIQDGPVLEEVVLVRDEVANMVWGVEKTISLVTGRPKPGSEAAAETTNFFRRLLDESLQSGPQVLPGPAPAAPIIYKVMNTVPENWIPFIPVHVENDNRATQLQRAAMPRILEGDPDPIPERIRPRTVLLRDGLELPRAHYFLHEEEVPRSGAIVSQAYHRTRWTDGRVVVWLGARKQVGRGEGSSGLAFDQIVNGAPASA